MKKHELIELELELIDEEIEAVISKEVLAELKFLRGLYAPKADLGKLEELIMSNLHDEKIRFFKLGVQKGMETATEMIFK